MPLCVVRAYISVVVLQLPIYCYNMIAVTEDVALLEQVTYEDRLAPESPAFWCTACYEMLHYGKDLNLKYYHRVFDYYGG